MAKKKATKKKATQKSTSSRVSAKATTSRKATKKKAVSKSAASRKKPAAKKKAVRKKATTDKKKALPRVAADTNAVPRKAVKKRKGVRRATTTAGIKSGKSVRKLGRSQIPIDAPLDIVFQNDQSAREAFVFLGIHTVRELEQYEPDELVRRLTSPAKQTVGRIRKILAMNNRSLENDEAFALEFQGTAVPDPHRSVTIAPVDRRRKSWSVSPVVFLLTSAVGSFLMGGIPFGYLVGRYVLHDDIRNHGSGNIGATNVGRVLGWNWGGLVLLLDALKGFLPTGLTYLLAQDHLPETWSIHTVVVAGMSAILGHMYPVYLKLRGGKGVATALGVVLVLAPRSMLVALIFFGIVLATTRRMALASITAALAFGINYLVLAGNTAWSLQSGSRTAFAICIPALIVWRHRSNISRLIAGTEPTVSQKVNSSSDVDAVADQGERPSGQGER